MMKIMDNKMEILERKTQNMEKTLNIQLRTEIKIIKENICKEMETEESRLIEQFGNIEEKMFEGMEETQANFINRMKVEKDRYNRKRKFTFRYYFNGISTIYSGTI